jgi:curved DNA-binding protein CbpA
VQNFYQLLSIEPTATPDEIKRAFRSEIARYHPDKVQHLAKEFQEMAASRAAALTEAYRTLMNVDLRAEYDRAHIAVVNAEPAGVPPVPSQAAAPAAPSQPHPSEPRRPARAEDNGTPSPRFASELRDRDSFVRSATLDRVRAALAAELGAADELPARGFDLDFEVKAKKLFSRSEGRRYAVKIVPVVDKLAVQDAWSAAQKLSVPICVFLMGNRLAPAKELADAISDARRRTHPGAGIAIIAVDLRDWTAHIPADTPSPCRGVLKRLRESSSV